MVLSGVGGRTIAEAQERLSFREYQSWQAYRAKRGSLNVGMRVERGSALLATLYANSKSKNGGFSIIDFMPHEEEPAIPLEAAMKEWG